MTTSISDGNSNVNQRIKQEFVAKHVYCNVNSMVEYILRQDDYKNAPFSLEDVTNYDVYPEYKGQFADYDGGGQDNLDEEIERLEELRDQMLDDDDDYGVIEDEIAELKDLGRDYQEVYEWYKVSDFLCRKLDALSHPVILDENIWGRCTTGQAILLDYAITQICSDMGILEGQENSWAI